LTGRASGDGLEARVRKLIACTGLADIFDEQ
jgi:hypothetical protein